MLNSLCFRYFPAQLPLLFLFCQIADLRVKSASPIEDYHGENIQPSLRLSSSKMNFEGRIDYKVANSLCAVHIVASWVVMDPYAANVLILGEEDIIQVTKEGNEEEELVE